MELSVLEKDQVNIENFCVYGSDLANFYNFYACTSYWAKDSIDNKVYRIYCFNPHVIDADFIESIKPNAVPIGIRPVLKCTEKEFAKFCSKKEVLFGTYPQAYVDPEVATFLEEHIDELPKLDQTYNIPSMPQIYGSYLLEGEAYLYKNTKYVCFPSNSEIHGRPLVHCWYQVSPVEWLVDNENRELICNSVLVSQMIFDESTAIYENSRLKRYLDTYMSKEMFGSFPKSILDTDEKVGDYFLGPKRKQLIKKGK